MKYSNYNEIMFMFNKIADKYDFMNNIISFFTHIYVKKQVIKDLSIKPNSKVLDLCCGTGDLGKIIKQMQPTCDIIGVDFSQNMIDIARKKNKNITYILADAINLPFEKNSFDYIVMGFGLRNIKYKNRAIEEIHRVLKSNGYFLHLDFGQKTFLSQIYDKFILILSKIFAKDTKPYKYLVISKQSFMSPQELIELFKFNKLNCIQSKTKFFNIITYQIMNKQTNQ